MVEDSQPSVKIDSLPRRARYHKIVAEKFPSIVNLDEVMQQNQKRRELEEKAKKAAEERVAQTLYQQSLNLQDSMYNLQDRILGIVNDHLSSPEGLAKFAALGSLGSPSDQKSSENQDKGGKGPEAGKALPPIEKSVGNLSSKNLKKRVIIEDGEPKNYHVDYTGKMIYYDNQK